MRLDAPPPPDVALEPGTPVRVGRFEFEVRFTPGHSPGSVSFVGQGMVFGGDVLFNGSVGRTDLPGGDTATLMATIQSQFLSLPDSTVVHSGHGRRHDHRRRAADQSVPDGGVSAWVTGRRSVRLGSQVVGAVRPPDRLPARPPVCNRCGFEVPVRAWGCKNPCPNCGTVYPLGDCSD